MTKRKARSRPSTVDEAAEQLISDMLIQHLQTLANMDENDFDLLCEKVAPYLIDEFELWQGNDALLASCLHCSSQRDIDPTRVILECVRKKIFDLQGFVVIT